MPRITTKITRSNFCNNFRRLRKGREITQGELARLCNMTTKQIHSYEVGDSLPNIEQAVVIARALNMSLDELCREQQERK